MTKTQHTNCDLCKDYLTVTPVFNDGESRQVECPRCVTEGSLYGIYSDRYANPWNPGHPCGPEWFHSQYDAEVRAIDLRAQFPQFSFYTKGRGA